MKRAKDMRRKSTELLTQAEWKIMKIVWEIESGSSREVIEIADKRHQWAPTTVKTLLGKLVEKGYLKTQEDGAKFIYRPSQPALQILENAADDFIEKSVEDIQGRLLCYMANKIRLSPGDVEELQAILDQHKENNPL
jgi:BlaI family transcriptional regulator, penicillinase repressor